MKRLFVCAIPVFSALFLIGCHGKRDANSHGPDTHTHYDDLAVLGNTDYFGAYDLEDEKYGTKTKVTITRNARLMVTNSLPNHKTGVFPNEGNPNTISAQNRTFSFPLNPKYTGKAEWIREPGIALNGIKFEPGTGEVVECESGESYRIEAMQNVIDLGLDYNHAHVQPTGAYHYHGTPTEVIREFDTGEDLVHIGFAHDGFPMYSSKSNAYKPSFKLVEGTREGENCNYTRPGISVDISEGGHHDGTFNSDFEFIAGSGDLDECNGITIDGQYMYLVTIDFPYIGRCLMGEFKSHERRGPPQGSDQGGPRGRPNVEQLLKQMDTDKDGKLSTEESKGPLKQNFSEIDTNDDSFISKEELEKGMSKRGKPRRGQ